jgi:hypothetical protein
MKSKRMIISWVNGQFEAWCPHLKGEQAYWRCPERIEQLEHWGGALKDAMRFLRVDGGQLEVVLAHPQMAHQMVETPPIKGMMLQRYLKRQVDQIKTFPAHAAWSWQMGQPILEQPNKKQHTAIVHFLPEELIKGMFAVAEKNGLHLSRVVPVTELILQALQSVDGEPHQVMLLVASVGTSTMVLVAEHSGPAHVVRVLKSHWDQQPDQLATDLNRTILYIQQTFGASVCGVWMLGAKEEQKLVMESLVHSPIHLLDFSEALGTWAHGAAKLAGKHIPNLVGLGLQRAPRIRLLVRVAAVVTVFLSLLALMVGAGVEYVVYQAQKRMEVLEPELARLKDREAKLLEIQNELNRKRAWINALAPDQEQHAPHWLLGYLGDTVPPELQITKFDARQNKRGWLVDMSGVYHGAYRTNEVTTKESVMLQFTQSLKNGPFHVRLLSEGSEGGGGLSQAAGGTTGHWMSSLSRTQPLVSSSRGTNNFYLKGVIQ